MSYRLSKILFSLLLVIGLGVTLTPLFANAATCAFTRTLSVDARGEDVRCLQQYLNTNGFIIAPSGAGSLGNETDQFGERTADAVKAWQSLHGLTPDGVFGPASRSKYTALKTTNTPVVQPAPVVGVGTSVDDILATLNKTTSQDEKDARAAIENAIERMQEVDDELDEADDDGRLSNGAEEYFDDAQDDLLEAVISFFDKKFAEATIRAEDALENLDDAYDETDGDDKDEAEEAIADAEDALDDAWNDIEDADDDGADVSDAEDLLDEAEDLLDQADDMLDDGDYDEAVDLADDAEDKIEDALDEIEDAEEDQDAQDAIDDAQDAIDDARDAIEEADDDGEDVDEAEDLLDEAEDALADAEDAFDDEDYDDAIDYAEEAEDLADEAIDAIGN